MNKDIKSILTDTWQKVIVIISIFMFLAFIGMTSYASIVGIKYIGLNENKINNCKIDVSFKEGKGINLTNTYPMDYVDAKNISPYTFYIKNNNSSCDNLRYTLTMENTCSGNVISDEFISYELVNVDTGEVIRGDGINNFNESFKIRSNGIDSYEMRIWINENATSSDIYINNDPNNSKKYCGKLNAEVIAYSNTLKDMLLYNNDIVKEEPTLTDSYDSAGDKLGLYVSTDTNDGRPTYYFRGGNGCRGVAMTEEICTLLGGTIFTASISSCRDKSYKYYFTNNLTQEQCLANGGIYDENAINNNLTFAGLMWRIVRINENGSIRLLLNDGINNNTKYKFNPTSNNYSYMYYSNSDVDNGVKRILDTWYDNNLKNYESYIADTEFCEQFKVALSSTWVTAGSVTVPLYSSYTSNFKCSTDGNGKVILTSKVGLLTIDEAVHAGNYYKKVSSSYITNSKYSYWLMSPAGASNDNYAHAWSVSKDSGIQSPSSSSTLVVRPVISLKAGILATGSGTKTDPYVIHSK